MEMSDKRMGGMKLGNFSGIKKPKSEPTKPAEPEVKPTQTKPVKSTKSKAKVGKKIQAKEQLVTVNIKIKKNG
jgi:hypothetical protein